MVLTLDSGNTSTKFGLFQDAQLVQTGVLQSPQQLQQLVTAHPVRHVMAATVAADLQPLLEALPTGCTFTQVSAALPLPFQIAYHTPATLGADRLAAVAGAHRLFKGQPVLVLDAGTCLTYDLLTADGTYLGGAISPGLQLRFKALHTFTARLPLLTVAPETPLIGQSTAESIRSGVQHAMRAEVEGMRAAYAAQLPGLVTVLCGGDAAFFDPKLQQPTFAVPELVLIGLYHISAHLHA